MKKEKLLWFIAGAAAVVGATVAVGMYLKKKAASLEEVNLDVSFDDCDCCDECDCDESDCCCEDVCCCEDECCDCGCEQEDCCAEEACDCGCQDEVTE